MLAPVAQPVRMLIPRSLLLLACTHAGMCRAHGIPHQRVTAAADLAPALTAAWGLNRHSVVEIVTDRSTNLQLHKSIQAAAQAAARAAYRLMLPSLPLTTPASAFLLAPAAVRGSAPATAANAVPAATPLLAPPLYITLLSWQRYELPLRQPLTTSAASTCEFRTCIVVSLTISECSPTSPSSTTSTPASPQTSPTPSNDQLAPSSSPHPSTTVRTWTGLGEVSPLPGLHSPRDLHQAEAQLALVSQLLTPYRDQPKTQATRSADQAAAAAGGLELPRSVALLGGRLGAWLHEALGFDPAQLCPSVR